MPTTVTQGDVRTVVIYNERTAVVGSSSAGPQGPAGPAGPQGPAGSGGAPEDLVFSYTGDVLQSVDGETFFLTFAYDVDGKLTTITNTVSGVVKTLAYDLTDRLVSITITP